MAIERTISIRKPDAVAKNVIGEIYSRFATTGLKIVAARLEQLSDAKAGGFYAVHKERPLYNDLVFFRISGGSRNVVVSVMLINIDKTHAVFSGQIIGTVVVRVR